MKIASIRGIAAAVVASLFLCTGFALTASAQTAPASNADEPIPLDLTPRGAWSASVTYVRDDLVTSRGSAWRARRTNLNKVPGSTAPSTARDWERFAAGFNPASLTDPSQMEQLLNQGIFEPKATPEQTAALERLETLLALIEGWVQIVVTAALGERIPGAGALSETLRRRRATGGPAEQTFATLVGLELRPRKLREAAVLWQRLTDAAGSDARDAVWQHPDLLPAAEDLDDPAGFIDRVIGGDTSGIDSAIDQALREFEKGDTPDSPPADN